MSEIKGYKEAYLAEDTKYIGRINTLDSKEVDVKKFPKNISRIVRTKSEGERLFNVGSDVWKEAYNPTLMTDLVDRLTDKDCKPKERKVIIRWIIGIRKIGQLYRNAWHLFDEKHEPPEELDSLIKAMGRLKDYPDDVEKNAKRLKKKANTYNKKRKKIDSEFKACKAKGFRIIIRDTENKTGYIFTKDEPRDVEAQHDARKNVRIVMNLLKLELIRDNNPFSKGRLKIEDAYFYFKAIDKKLGEAHDEFYIDLRKGKKHPDMVITEKTKRKSIEGMKMLVDQWEDEIVKENKKKDKKRNKKKKDKKSERNKRKYEKEKRKKEKRKKKKRKKKGKKG